MDAGRYVCRDTMGGWPGDWIIHRTGIAMVAQKKRLLGS